MRCFSPLIFGVHGAAVLLLAVPATNATTFTVTTTNDVGPGSLRQAIHAANASSGPDTITFNIPGDGVPTIAPATPLPAITNFAYLNAATQPVVWMVRLDGVNLTGPGEYALTLKANNCLVRGLVIVRFPNGILIDSGSGNSIVGNRIGLDLDGIARGMTFDGITVTCPVFGSAMNNVIGGTVLGEGNVISGNGTGISFYPVTAANNFVLGNLIGTDTTGTLPRGNVFAGIAIQGATNITIGGPAPAARNVLSASTGAGGSGVILNGGGGHLIQGNLIGTDVSGQYDLGNSSDGVFLFSADSVRVLGNQIVNNRANGLNLNGANRNTIEGNCIGTDFAATRPLGNALAGITCTGSTNRIGGLNAGQGNTIQFNGDAGVAVMLGSRNEVSGNRIYDNGGLGLDLGFSGVTLNDAGDTDTGANELQNHPLLASANSEYGATRVQGTLNSASAATFRLEFFASPAFDPTGNSEGQLFLGSSNVTTDGGGSAAFNLALPNATPTNYLVTATATDAGGNTSEFSPGVLIASGPQETALRITPTGGHAASVGWLGAASLFQLETTGVLSPTSRWQTVTSGIVELGEVKSFTISSAGGTNQFFRLKKLTP